MSKLVRDHIPKILSEEKKQLYQFTIVDHEQYNHFLKEKLLEETKEYLESETIEELADLFEVIEAIIKLRNFDFQEIKNIQKKKRDERGSFEKRILMTKKS